MFRASCEVWGVHACHDTQEDVAGGYRSRVHANLSPSIDSNFEMFDSLATFTAALPRKEKKELWLRGKNVHFTPWVFGWVLVILYIDLQPLATLLTRLSSSAPAPHTSTLYVAQHNREITLECNNYAALGNMSLERPVVPSSQSFISPFIGLVI